MLNFGLRKFILKFGSGSKFNLVLLLSHSKTLHTESVKAEASASFFSIAAQYGRFYRKIDDTINILGPCYFKSSGRIKHLASIQDVVAVVRRQNFTTLASSSEESNDKFYLRGEEPGDRIPFPPGVYPEEILDEINDPDEMLASKLNKTGTNKQTTVTNLRDDYGKEARVQRQKEIYVGKNTEVKSLASAISWRLRDDDKCLVLASGDMAVNQAVKGIAIARFHLNSKNEGDLVFQVNHVFRHDRNSSNQLTFRITKIKDKFEIYTKPEIIRVKGDSEVLALGKSIKISVDRNRISNVQAVGPGALAKAMVAFTWARRMCLALNKDLECCPEFQTIETETSRLHMVCLHIRQKFIPYVIKDENEIFAIDPLPFLPSTKSLADSFTGVGELDLQVIKVSSATHPNKAAAALVTYLRTQGGVQIFSTGALANNQTLKALCVCRRYVTEQRGIDLAFKCMHAPRDNNNGECQVITSAYIVPKDDESLKGLSESESMMFRIGNSSDAKSVGTAMAGQALWHRKIECSAVGIGAVSRAMVATSHARLLIAKDNLDLVVFPKFENTTSVIDNEMKQVVRLKLDIVIFTKNKTTSVL